MNAGTDVYTAACDYTRNKLISLGIPSEKVFTTGIPTDEGKSHLSNRQSNSTALPVKSYEPGRHNTSHQLIQSTSQKASPIQTHNFHAHSPVLVEGAVEGRNDSDLYVNSPQSNLQSNSVAPPVKSEERNGSNLYISSGGRDWLRRQLYH